MFPALTEANKQEKPDVVRPPLAATGLKPRPPGWNRELSRASEVSGRERQGRLDTVALEQGEPGGSTDTGQWLKVDRLRNWYRRRLLVFPRWCRPVNHVYCVPDATCVKSLYDCWNRILICCVCF